MKKLKKAFSLTLVCALICSLFCVPASASGYVGVEDKAAIIGEESNGYFHEGVLKLDQSLIDIVNDENFGSIFLVPIGTTVLKESTYDGRNAYDVMLGGICHPDGTDFTYQEFFAATGKYSPLSAPFKITTDDYYRIYLLGGTPEDIEHWIAFTVKGVTDGGTTTPTDPSTPTDPCADGHDYTSKVTREPTATREGARTYTCSRCGDTYTESIAALGNEAAGPAAGMALSSPVKSNNLNKQNYTTWSTPVKSYLSENQHGGLTRVEYVDNQVIIEDYDKDFKYLSGRTISPELPIWGGFFSGEKYNFLIFGQENKEENNQKEVIRVVKYSKDWQRMGQASLKGANTTVPFYAGSLRCDENNGYLYIRTCHEMYAGRDGINHQANLTMAVRQSDMSITDDFHSVMNLAVGYVSHSFNQFILADQENRLIALDHGDAYPRAAALVRYNRSASEGNVSGPCSSVTVQAFPGTIGQNSTGATFGGLAETASGYVVAYNYDSAGSDNNRQEYLAYIGKNSQSSTNTQLSIEPGSTPVLASTGLSGGYMLWNGKTGYNINDTLYYLQYGADGKPNEPQTAVASLSDCQPISYNGKVVWYTTNNSLPTFYQLDKSGVTSVVTADSTAPADPDQPPAIAVEDIPARGTAKASTQSVEVDGRKVEFQMYALLDANGNGTNYVKLRDLAHVLNGTRAQFSIGYSNQTGITATTGQPYQDNGSEMKTPFSGDRAYTGGAQSVQINGKAVAMTAINLLDDNGGGYNYFKLRDLGAAFGFNVGWSAERGVYVETDKSYIG